MYELWIGHWGYVGKQQGFAWSPVKKIGTYDNHDAANAVVNQLEPELYKKAKIIHG